MTITAPDPVTEPVAPAHPELVRAAEILRERGLNSGAYGDLGEQRCTVGALVEATGHNFSRPTYSPCSERYSQLYSLVLAAVPDGSETIEEYSDALHGRSRDAAGEMATFLERLAFGI